MKAPSITVILVTIVVGGVLLYNKAPWWTYIFAAVFVLLMYVRKIGRQERRRK